MSELISATKPAFYVVKRSFLWVISKFSKYLQKKFFPLDLELIRVELKDVPKIFCRGHDTYFRIDLAASNYSPYYDYEILSIQIECDIGRKKFVTIPSTKFISLKSGTYSQDYSFNKYLGFSGEKRAKEQFNDTEVCNGSIELNMTLVTPFGVKSHKVSISNQFHLVDN
ncbi:hypothetical protein [Gracilimonas sp.]|uniref:hypothetical protein n=1 Tax=Gracilimonas sp. TaxID=1974203 RepID=UPI0032EBB24A